MSEPKMFLVLLWTDNGFPNCNVYENVNAIDNPDDRPAAERAVEHPGDLVPSEDGFYKYTAVAPV